MWSWENKDGLIREFKKILKNVYSAQKYFRAIHMLGNIFITAIEKRLRKLTQIK